MKKKIDLDDPKAWSNLDWSEPIVPEILKKTDGAIAIGRSNRLKSDHIREKTTEAWQDPDHRAKMVDIHNNRNEEWNQKIKQANQWENRSEEAKQNHAQSRKELPNNPNYIEGMQRRKDNDWHIKNAIAHKDKNKNPKNIRVCEHCQKQTTANTHERHLKSCLFVKGPITTYIGDEPQYEYATEQALIDDGFDIMRIKQVINTNKEHGGWLFKQAKNL
jgi:hypothetical protein